MAESGTIFRIWPLKAILTAIHILIPGGYISAGEEFVDVSAASGIGEYINADGMNAGAAVADFDGDGDLDIFVPNGHSTPDQLYRNQGNGQFDEVASAFNLDSTRNSRAALWFDYDADADLDLLVVADDFQRSDGFAPSNLTLYRHNSDATFTDVTVASGLFRALNDPITNPDNHLGGVAAGDLDNDGYLELLVTFWQGYAFLYRNNRDGTFTEATALTRPFETYWQPVIADFDRDGYQDLFLAVDFNQNLYFHNQRDGTLAELGASLSMQNDEQNDMGVSVGDVDNDGDLDFFVTNVFSGENRRNHLYLNDSVPGVPLFSETAVTSGVADAGWGWGATFADFNNDTHLDLAVTNGFFGEDDASRLFRHEGHNPPTFMDVAAQENFDDTHWGGCLLSFDADNDGDLDFLQTTVNGPLRLLANSNNSGGGYLRVRPRMREGNRFAVGAVVKIEVGSTVMTRPISAGTSLLCQEPAEAFFGLGPATVVDRITVEWPGGRFSTLTQVPANQTIVMTDGLIFNNGMESIKRLQ